MIDITELKNLIVLVHDYEQCYNTYEKYVYERIIQNYIIDLYKVIKNEKY